MRGNMSYLARFLRFHLGGRYEPESRDALGWQQLQHGNGLLHGCAEASTGTDILGLLGSETDNFRVLCFLQA